MKTPLLDAPSLVTLAATVPGGAASWQSGSARRSR